jgi:uncharacterized protein YxeA
MKTKRIMKSALAVIMAVMMMLLASCGAAEEVSADGDNHLTRAEEEAEETVAETEAKAVEKAEETTTKAPETTVAETTAETENMGSLPIKLYSQVDHFLYYGEFILSRDGVIKKRNEDTHEYEAVIDNVRDLRNLGDSYYYVKNDNTLWAWGSVNGKSCDEAVKIRDNVANFFYDYRRVEIVLTLDKELIDFNDYVYAENVVEVFDSPGRFLFLTADGDLYCDYNYKIGSNISDIVMWSDFNDYAIVKDMDGRFIRYYYGVSNPEETKFLFPEDTKEVIDDSTFIKTDGSLWHKEFASEEFVKYADNVAYVVSDSYYVTNDGTFYTFDRDNPTQINLDIGNIVDYILLYNIQKVPFVKNDKGDWYYLANDGGNILPWNDDPYNNHGADFMPPTETVYNG